jgi:hypothetical protein
VIFSPRRCCITHCNRSPVLLPIVLPLLLIAAAATHCDHTAAVHCDRRCHPSRIASVCVASALAAFACCPLCPPSCHPHPVSHCNCFTFPPPIVPPMLPIAAVAIHCNHPPLSITTPLPPTVLRCLLLHCLCLGGDHPPPIVLSITLPPSHCPLQLLAVPSPIAPPLPIAATAIHCNLAAAVHRDCCCPSCVTSQCATSVLAVIVRRPTMAYLSSSLSSRGLLSV